MFSMTSVRSSFLVGAGTRLPGVDPVDVLPGLPFVPGSVRRPVPSIHGPLQHPAHRRTV